MHTQIANDSLLPTVNGGNGQIIELSPHRLWSLWEIMEALKVDRLLSLIRSLVNNAGMSLNDDAPIPHGFREFVIKDFRSLKEVCDSLDLFVAGRQIQMALDLLALRPSQGETGTINRAVNMVASTIETELSVKMVFIVPPERAKFFNGAALFGAEVESKFPSASPEVAEAGKCLALGRYTAAVYHLMRALEVGLNCLAQRMGVPFANQNWQTILDQIEKSIRGMSSVTHGPDWKQEEHFYSEAAAHFRIVKNAWRNYAMHLHERYDPERATDIFNSTRAFMRHLATKLQEE